MEDKQAAVKMKIFGKLTRETFEWHPDKLLCKRFNVPNPYPGYAPDQTQLSRQGFLSYPCELNSDWSCRSSVVGLPKVRRDKFSVFNFLTMESRETAGGFTQEPVLSHINVMV